VRVNPELSKLLEKEKIEGAELKTLMGEATQVSDLNPTP
jgi:hypothetical protein